MSIYKHKGSPFWHFDFQYRGHRFHGSTRCRNRREAEAVEKAEREKAKQLLKGKRPADAANLTINSAAGRYWTEVGRHHVCHKETWTNLERLVEYFGKDKLLAEITDDNIARMVAWRRSHSRWGRKDMQLIAPATVNRSTTEIMQKLFCHARRSWKLGFDNEPDWKRHMLKEPQERVRELRVDEADKLEDAIRSDYWPFLDFARASGQRLKECLMLKWSDVDWSEGIIRTTGKGGRLVVIWITPTIASILFPLRGHHPERVFTYVAQRTRGALVKGQRYPLTVSGTKTMWRRLRSKARLEDFRFHDIRHDVGTKLLRRTGNLKLVQKALNHADIKTTTRYAHVLDEEVAEALDGLQKSRKNSRTTGRTAS
jgi:integrase